MPERRNPPAAAKRNRPSGRERPRSMAQGLPLSFLENALFGESVLPLSPPDIAAQPFSMRQSTAAPSGRKDSFELLRSGMAFFRRCAAPFECHRTAAEPKKPAPRLISYAGEAARSIRAHSSARAPRAEKAARGSTDSRFPCGSRPPRRPAERIRSSFYAAAWCFFADAQRRLIVIEQPQNRKEPVLRLTSYAEEAARSIQAHSSARAPRAAKAARGSTDSRFPCGSRPPRRPAERIRSSFCAAAWRFFFHRR